MNTQQTPKLHKHSVMPRFLGIATEISTYAKRYLCEDEIEDIEQYLPCEAFESSEIADVDNSYLIMLDGMTNRDEYIHKDILIINGA